MNPLTNVKNIIKLNETELATGSIHKKSWHDMYKDSAWIFIGGLSYGLTEGDILAVFSQYGEIVNINLVRDKKTGKTKGFCFLCYANQKSTVLAVDNLNGIKLCSRTIRVDHVSNYKPPKEDERDDEITKTLKAAGCAPKPFQTDKVEDMTKLQPKKKKSKKEKKEKKKKKKKSSNRSDSENETCAIKDIEVKKEKHDPGYDKYDTSLSRRQEKSNYSERVKDESSHIHEKHYSRSLATIKKRYSDNSSDEDNIRKNNKQERESSHFKELYRKDNTSTSYNDSKHVSSSKSHKRHRSSSSDGDSRNRKFSGRSEKLLSKSRRSDSKKQKSSNSSSSDDESSSESSSDSEKDKNGKSKKTRREQYEKEIMRETSYKREITRETAYERKLSNEKVLEKDKSCSKKSKYDQREDSDFSPNRKEQYARLEKYTDHRSKHRSDDKYSNSHKRKYDKR